MSRAVQSGKSVIFGDCSPKFVNEAGETTAVGVRQGCLHYLSCIVKPQESAYVTRTDNRERLWDRRFGHLNEQSMRKLVREELVDHLDYSTSEEIGICEARIGGKQCKSAFDQSKRVTLMPLELVHSDVCGKMGQKSLGGAEYFLTLLDDKTHYTWVYPLKTKDKVF